MNIKVLGPGCAKCKEADALVRKVAEEMGINANIEKVTDIQEMLKLGVLSTPAVVVDGQVKCTGRIPSRDELLAWLA